MITLTPASPGPAPQAAPAAAAADALPGGTPALPHDAAPALPFAQWLGQLADAGAPADFAAGEAPVAAATDAPAATADTGTDETDTGAAPDLPAPQPAPLAAMAMPLMPMPLAAAMHEARASGLRLAASASAAAGIAPARPAPAAQDDAPQAVADARRGTLPAPPPAAQSAEPALAAASDAVTRATPATARGASAPDASPEPATKGDPGGAGRDMLAAAAVTAHSAGAPQAGADTVALAGPPTAWRQSLHQALGERLHLQLGHGLEQAVIRLDPPQLGRVEIAIRHSAGSLEVTLSATNGEVLRQLHGVSDSLRSDLAQRQYVDVAVTVVPAPRSSAAANPFAGDGQRHGGQPRREQDEHAPGLALLDTDAAFDATAGASSPASPFTLTGRK